METRDNASGVSTPPPAPAVTGNVSLEPVAKAGNLLNARLNVNGTSTRPSQRMTAVKARTAGKPEGTRSSLYSKQWFCSVCKMTLAADDVVKGNAALIDGNLQCDTCIKSATRKLEVQRSRARLLTGLGVGTVAAISIMAVFLPSQALVLALATGACAVLLGASGMTLSSRARLITVATGLVMISLSASGIVLLSDKKKEHEAQSEIAVQVDQVKSMLEKDNVAEAEMRIDVIEKEANSKYSGNPTPAVKKAIADLRVMTEQWQQKRFGNLQKADQQVLNDLFHRLGSLTPYTQQRRVNSLKVDGTHLSVVVATDVKPPAFENSTDDGTTVNPDTDNPIKAEALRVCMISLKSNHALESVDVKVISGDGKELFSKSFDSQKVAALRNSMVPVNAKPDPLSKACLPIVKPTP